MSNSMEKSVPNLGRWGEAMDGAWWVPWRCSETID